MFTAEPILDLLLRGLILTALAMFWVVMLVRVNGLRSFSKMTNFDFVMTVAVGSLLAGAGQSTSWTAFAQTLAAMTSLFLVQYLTARLRKASNTFATLVQNQPVVLMRDGKIFDEALVKTRVERSDLIAKLREANVLDFSEVRAVILETTGDISVLHGDQCVEELLQGTQRVDRHHKDQKSISNHR
ncbi:MAG: DUF421 domain-containing protein [Leptolyngbyaceae cyanobacterium]